jgi:NTP pyrophosphatase (non-canonical NTP hydrolase)
MNNREEDNSSMNKIDKHIKQIQACGFRYANYKLCLRRNRIKINPESLTYDYLLARLKEEVNELEITMRHKGLLDTPEINPQAQMIENVANEAADVINFASMICYKTEYVN